MRVLISIRTDRMARLDVSGMEQVDLLTCDNVFLAVVALEGPDFVNLLFAHVVPSMCTVMEQLDGLSDIVRKHHADGDAVSMQIKRAGVSKSKREIVDGPRERPPDTAVHKV